MRVGSLPRPGAGEVRCQRIDHRRARIEAIRAAHPTADVYGLWVDYDVEEGRALYIGWSYFQRVCREFDRSHPHTPDSAR